MKILNNFYTVEYKDESKAIIKLSDENHPIFKAHFPGNPIMPGFVNFEIVADVFNLDITNIKRAKFLKIVLPNQILTYQKNNNKFKVFCNEEEVASFVL